jgi:hypothetical protein
MARNEDRDVETAITGRPAAKAACGTEVVRQRVLRDWSAITLAHGVRSAPIRMGLRTRTILASLLLMIAVPAGAQATGRVGGRVLDQTGGVLRGVTIDLVVEATELTTTTDAQGQYRFDAVPAGRAELTYRLLNFSVIRQIVDVAAGESVVTDIVMTLSLNADVVVTGTCEDSISITAPTSRPPSPAYP